MNVAVSSPETFNKDDLFTFPSSASPARLSVREKSVNGEVNSSTFYPSIYISLLWLSLRKPIPYTTSYSCGVFIVSLTVSNNCALAAQAIILTTTECCVNIANVLISYRFTQRQTDDVSMPEFDCFCLSKHDRCPLHMSHITCPMLQHTLETSSCFTRFDYNGET